MYCKSEEMVKEMIKKSIIAGGGLILVIWACMVVNINVKSENVQYKYYGLKEDVEYKDIVFNVYDCGWIKERELSDKYGISLRRDLQADVAWDEFDEDKGFLIYVTWIEIENTCDENVNLFDQLMYTTSVASVATAVTYNASIGIDEHGNKTDIASCAIAPQEKLKIGLIATIYIPNLADKYVEHIDEYPLYMELEDYEGSRFIRRIKLN